MEKQRFVLIENNEKFKADERTCWYWDTKRPAKNGQPYIAVQCYKDRDPNTQIVYHERMALLFTDQAEYYAVCMNCRYSYGDMQWSGNTHNRHWREDSAAYLKKHQETKGWCEFCDPVFGNGGWCR